MNKKLLLLFLLLHSSYTFSETWSCVTENERKEYNKSQHIRDGSNFKFYVNGQYNGTDKIIEENKKEIVLYFETSVETFITILEKQKKTIVTYGSTGNDPNKELPPGFGKCEITD